MIVCSDYYVIVKYFQTDTPTDTVRWEKCDSSGLAEIIEMAQDKGYKYHLEIRTDCEKVEDCELETKVRIMVFEKV